MHRRTVIGLAAALVATAATLAAARAPDARASSRPGTWTAYAESAGVRAGILKPAALPTSDEVAALSIPYARTETDSAPIGRAIGSWLWPGEGIADSKSLLLVGLDPSAAQSEVDQRKRRHPGSTGCDPERALATPEMPPQGPVPGVPPQPIVNPVNGQPVYDPTDNPCGEVAVRRALQTLVRERVPAFPFWAHSSWPGNGPSDARDERTFCTTTTAFPSQWQMQSDVCPAGVPMPRTGYVSATSDADADRGIAQVTELVVPGIARIGSLTSLARTEWQRDVLVSSSSVRLGDVTILDANEQPFIHLDAIVAGAVATSDDRAPEGSLSVSGVTVTLGGTTYEARVARGRIEIADERLPDSVQTQLDRALDLATISHGQTIEFGDQSAAASASGAAAGIDIDPVTRSARVAALVVELGADDRVDGSSTVRLAFGVAEARALTRASTFSFTPPSYTPTYRPGTPALAGVPPAVTTHPGAPGAQATRRPANPAFTSAAQRPPSEPVPVAVVVVALLAVLVAAGAMVSAGIWETLDARAQS